MTTIAATTNAETREEALQNIQEAMTLWVEVARETGQAVPESVCQRSVFWPALAGESANSAMAV